MTERGLSSSPRAPPRAHSAAGDPVGAVAAREYAAMNSPELLHQTQRWFGLAPLLIIALACSSSEGPSVPPGGKALYVVNSGANSVAAYAPGASGDAAPTDVIHGGRNLGLNGPRGIALDAAGNIYVANYGVGTVTVYAPGASGNAAPTARIGGSNTDLSYPVGIALDTTGRIYVANASTNDNITIYAPAASGNATPIDTIAGSNTGLNAGGALALDSAGNLYVANYYGSSITVYAPGASGNATPSTTIAGSNAGLSWPWGIARDAADNLYVVNSWSSIGSTSITVYAAGASGNVAPIATIGGSSSTDNTGLNYPVGIARDGAGRLYVTNPGPNTVTVFAAGATGNATPATTISTISPANQTGYPTGIALDPARNVYVTNNQYRATGSGIYPSVTVYAPGAGGTAAPTRTITGAHTGMNGPVGIARDAAGNLYVANAGNSCCGLGNSITVYGAGARGDAAPTATIVGGNTGLDAPSGVALDAAGHLYVANADGNSITVYGSRATGNATPSATITGGSTGLNRPVGIALGVAGRIYVANSGDNSITVYAAGASGNAAPLLTIAGATTGLNAPLGITF